MLTELGVFFLSDQIFGINLQLEPEVGLVITMGNLRVSHAVPAPAPVATRTHDPAGLPIKTNQKTAKTVKN